MTCKLFLLVNKWMLGLIFIGSLNLLSSQPVDVVVYPGEKMQIIDGFGAHQGDEVRNDAWWHELYYDDAGASIYRVDLTPRLVRPYSDFNVYSPWFMGGGVDSEFNLEDPDNPDGPEENRVRTYTSAVDYSRTFGGKNAPIAVMGPEIEENIKYFSYPAHEAIPEGMSRAEEYDDFKLIGSLWSPLPWLKISSGNTYNQNWWPGPVQGTPWPFIWGGNFAGGTLDVSDLPLEVFDDTALGGNGPTSALTQFARSVAAHISGFQKHYGVQFYAISIQNELNFEQYYNSATYPLSSQYIEAIKAVRAEFDRYDDLKNIRLMGPEDLLGGDAYGLWQYRGGEDAIHKNLQYLHHMSMDSSALDALDFFCIHGYAPDGVSAQGSDPIQWTWWANGWEESPAPGIPGQIKGFTDFGKKSWMTETSGEHHDWIYPKEGYPNNGGWSIAVKIHQALTAGRQSAWLYWTFTEAESSGATSTYALTTQALGNSAPKYNAFKHFSKHIRPGFYRVGAVSDNDQDILVSAYYHQEEGSLVLVLINTTSEEKAVNFTLSEMDVSGEFESFTSMEGSYWNPSEVPYQGGEGTVSVPGFGVVTLVSHGVMTSLKPEILSGNLSIHPNPARDHIRVSWDSKASSEAKLTIVNSMGKVMIDRHVYRVQVDPKVTVDITDLPVGVYFVRLTSSDYNQTGKVLISR